MRDAVIKRTVPVSPKKRFTAGIIEGAADGRGRGRQGMFPVFISAVLLTDTLPVIAGMPSSSDWYKVH